MMQRAANFVVTHPLLTGLISVGVIAGGLVALYAAKTPPKALGGGAKPASGGGGSSSGGGGGATLTAVFEQRDAQGARFVVVKRGDTLSNIGDATDTDWHDLARWNRISNPARIDVGDVIYLEDPAARAGNLYSSLS